MWASLTKHWFLTALGVCFATGYVASESLEPLLRLSALRGGIVFAVMWAMGVTLQPGTIRRSVGRPMPVLLAIGINMLVVPLFCLPMAWVLPERLFGGLFIAGIVPCTLASASVWTRKAGGDDSIAMMTTVVTNLACLVVVPLGVSLVLAESADVSAIDQMKKLAAVVVAPLILSQVMRRFGWASWADRNKPRLAVFGQLGILTMVVFGAVAGATAMQKTGAVEPSGAVQGAAGLMPGVTMAIAAVAIHVMVLSLGIALARRFGFDRASQIAIGIAGSQKTLMVGLQIAIECQVSVVPMLIYHLGQLVIDTIVAARWQRASDVASSPAPRSEPEPQSGSGEG